MRTFHVLALPLLLALTLAGCGENDMRVCTALFATSSITVVDSMNAPAAAATVVSVLVRTGDTLPVTSLIDHVPGGYTILDDGSVKRLHRSGDQVRVTASQNGATAQATYGFDAPDGCHINRVSGPDTLTLH